MSSNNVLCVSTAEFFTGTAIWILPKMASSKDKEIKELVKHMLSWKHHHQDLNPDDVINFMIEYDLISSSDVKELIKEKVNITCRLPMNYNVHRENEQKE